MYKSPLLPYVNQVKTDQAASKDRLVCHTNTILESFITPRSYHNYRPHHLVFNRTSVREKGIPITRLQSVRNLKLDLLRCIMSGKGSLDA